MLKYLKNRVLCHHYFHHIASRVYLFECSCLCLNLLVSVDPSSSLSISPSEPVNPVMSNAKKVIIVGAGASGIAAASRLVEKGVKDVLIIEAEDRIGGRIYTLDVPGGDGAVEIGAQWVHGEKGNVVYELASAKNLVAPSETLFGDITFVQSSGQIIDPDLSSKLWKLFENVRTTGDINVTEYKTSGNYFLEQINSALQNGNYSISEDLKSQFIELCHQFINSVDGSDSWFQSSASTLTEYWECEGNSAITWKQNGYRRLFSLLTEKANSILGKSLLDNYVKRHTEVVKIIPEGTKVRVRCDNGEEYVADHVIVTVSLGVLQANYQNLFPQNTLSDKQQKAIQNLLIGSVAKLYLKFPHKWWPDNTSDIALLWNEADKLYYEKQGLKWITDVFVFMVTEHHNTMLCGWVCGQSARDMEAFDEQLVKTQLMQMLRKFLGNKYNIPDPDWFYRSTWKSNPHFSGTYSLRGVAADFTNVSAIDLSAPVLNKDNVPVILFAGEATHPHFYSTVHGAVETGWREADRIISLKKPAK